MLPYAEAIQEQNRNLNIRGYFAPVCLHLRLRKMSL